jgi:hypothetical protein
MRLWSANLNKNIHKLLLLISFATLSNQSVAQNVPPSLADTLSWMDSTYNTHTGGGGGFGHGVEEIFSDGKLFKRRTSSFTYDGCVMTVVKQDDPASPVYSNLYTYTKTSFSLHDIDKNEIKTYLLDPQYGGLKCISDKMQCTTAEVELLTYSQKPLMDEEFLATYPNLNAPERESRDSRKTYVAEFFVDDAEYAKRFVNALRYAVGLCGGKPSPF